MKISRFLAITVAAILAASVLQAQQKSRVYGVDDPGARTLPNGSVGSFVNDIKGEVSVSLTSKYVFRGVQRTNLAFQPAITLEHKSGVYFNGFFNVPTSHAHDAEYDFNLGYNHELNKNLELDGGIVLYLTPGFEDAAGQDLRKWTQEFYVGGKYKICPNFGARVYFYYDARCEQLTSELALGYSLKLSPSYSYMPANLNFSLYLGYSSGNDVLPDLAGPKVEDSYSYYGASVEAPVRLTDKLSSNFGVQYGKSHNYMAGPLSDNSNHFWVFGSLSYNF